MFYEWCLGFSNFSNSEFINFFPFFLLKTVKGVHAISNPGLMCVCFPSSMDRRRHLQPLHCLCSSAHSFCTRLWDGCKGLRSCFCSYQNTELQESLFRLFYFLSPSCASMTWFESVGLNTPSYR